MDVVAIVPAAGKGFRIGGPVKKQFLLLDGKPILSWTLLPFQECSRVDRIICVVPARQIRFCWEEVVRPYGLAKVRRVVKGGICRQESVRKGLEAMDWECDIVIIHDGVRPFVSVEMLERSVDAASKHGAAVFAVPVVDTVNAVKEGMVIHTLPREEIWQVQTPQAFTYDIIMEAYERAMNDGYTGTDDASLVERLGHPVMILKGSTRNIKITTQEDLELARAILAIHHSK